MLEAQHESALAELERMEARVAAGEKEKEDLRKIFGTLDTAKGVASATHALDCMVEVRHPPSPSSAQ